MARIVTKSEYRRRRVEFQIAAGLMDFVIIIGSFLVFAVALWLLFMLFGWVKADMPNTLGEFIDILKRTLRLNGV